MNVSHWILTVSKSSDPILIIMAFKGSVFLKGTNDE